jgi:hypothetical protein
MNKHETDAIRRSHTRLRMHQPAAMFVPVRPDQSGEMVELQKQAGTCLMKNPARSTAYVLAYIVTQN